MLLTRRRVLAAKVETTPGDIETLAAGDAAFNVFDTELQAQVDWTEREGQSAFSPLAGAPGGHGAQVTFATELAGSGSAGSPVPAWADVFFPACGWTKTDETFSPDSVPPQADGANTKTLTIGAYENGLLKQIRGAMGTFAIRFVAGQIVRIEWTFTGLWVAPSDVGLLAPTYPIVSPKRFASSELTIASFSPKVAELSIEAGNEVTLREDSGDATGYATAVITGRRVTGSLNPEANLIAAYDPNALWLNRTEQALAIKLGSGSADGNTIELAAPKLQFSGVQEGNRNNLQTDEIEFQLNRSASAGDDELTIDFA